jgi:SecD-like export protein
MTGLHETFADMAAEITPIDPPVELTMLRGRRVRSRRRTAVGAGVACAMALVVGAVVGIPALTGRPAGQGGAGTSTTVKPLGDAFQVRPVLLRASPGSTTGYGDARLVNAATMRLFDKLTCAPGLNDIAVDDHWKATVGYGAAQWNAPGSEIVSCDAAGDKYVLGQAVFGAKDISSVAAGQQRNSGQWVVDLALNGKATAAFGTLTTKQYSTYYSGVERGNEDDAVLDSIAVVINGDVQSAPQTDGPITFGMVQITGPQPAGFTEAQAKALAAQL